MALLIGAAGLIDPVSVPRAAAQHTQPAPVEVVPGRFIVILAAGFTQSSDEFAAALNREAGIDIDLTYNTAFSGFAGSFSTAAIEKLMTDPAVAEVNPDFQVHAQGQSLEPNIDRVDADQSDAKSGDGHGDVDVDVAVIDSGVGPNEDINIAGGYNCMGDGYMRDYYGHGTHVAGIIGARDNGFGVVGMAPGARIWQVRVLDHYGGGTWSQIICGMDWVASHADVIEVANMSLGAGMPENGNGCDSSPAHRAICAMTNAGVTVVAAACNANMDAGTCTPGKYPEVISVSAFAEWDGKPGGLAGCRTTPDGFYGCDDQRASFSNYGPTVDIAAPGVGVRSTLFDDRYGYWSGTSMATPHVTGAAALLRARYGPVSPAAVRQRLLLIAMSGPVPGDPDAYPEPILNVASLGPGSITHLQSVRNGDRVMITASDLIPDTRAIFRLDGVYIGGATVDSDGAAHRTVAMNGLAYGGHRISVRNNRKSLSDSFLVRPAVAVSASSVIVGQAVTVALSGYTAGSSVLVTLDTGNGARSLTRVRVDGTGAGSSVVVIPAAAGGSRRVTALDSAGVSTYSHLSIRPTLSAGSPVVAGDWDPVVLRGFHSGESVDLHWGSQTGAVLKTKVTTGTGSGDLNIQIPAVTDPGKHSLWAVGTSGTALRITVSTTSQASEPTPPPAPTVTETATVIGSSPTASETATFIASSTATETHPPLATETAQPTATETPLPIESATVPVPEPTIDGSPTSN